MNKYTVFECLDCKSKAMYPSRTADGRMCEQCGSRFFIPIYEGDKTEMITKHINEIPPRVKKNEFSLRARGPGGGTSKTDFLRFSCDGGVWFDG